MNWISFKDNFPKKEGKYLFLYIDGSVKIFVAYTHVTFYTDTDQVISLDVKEIFQPPFWRDPTHWMYIEEPKDECRSEDLSSP